MADHQLGQAAGGIPPTAATVRSILGQSLVFAGALTRCAALGLPGWYLAAGCVTQTIWNYLTDRPLDTGIRDYDLIYFDDSDTSWEAENEVIERADSLMADIPIQLEVRNQARVHLWYRQRFGIPCPPYESSEAAIATFPATATCIGVRLLPTGGWHLHAPFGLADLFSLTVRPNRALAPPEVYAAKTERWLKCWPELCVMPYESS